MFVLFVCSWSWLWWSMVAYAWSFCLGVGSVHERYAGSYKFSTLLAMFFMVQIRRMVVVL